MPFIAAAEEFYARFGNDPLFATVGRLLRCSDEEQRALVIKKIYCMSIPENTHEPAEPAARAYAALLLLPFKLLLARRLLWAAAPRADYTLETITPDYFNRWFAELFAALPGRKRLTPRYPADFDAYETTGSALGFACLGDFIRLLLAAPALTWLSWRLARRSGISVAQAARKTLSMYATWRGYFKRYPTRHFITYSDELNAPGRWLAFRQTCPGRLLVIQNGERTLHPCFAYGAVDRYYLFGQRYIDIMRALAVKADAFEAVGALCLNEHHARLSPLLRDRQEPLYDILIADQGVSHNGLLESTNRSIERMLEHVGRYQSRRQGLRVAYQLRPYTSRDSLAERDARQAAARFLPRGVVLENQARGDSYANGLRAKVVVMFQSTIGFELLRLGQNVLFVNLSGDPTETICEDARFQHEDAAGDYERFERKLDEALARRLDAPPETALQRHASFDGQVQQRLARMIAEGAP